MNRATDTDSARFGYEAGREAGWRDATNAVAVSMVERGHSASTIAPIIRDMRNAR